jgi:hypothetical protein
VHPDPLHRASPSDRIEVLLDGVSVHLPSDRRSFEAIRCHVESIALGQQRFLGSIHVVSPAPHKPKSAGIGGGKFRVEAHTMELGNRMLLILMTALEQTTNTMHRVRSAISQVLINDAPVAREIWWGLANELRQPVLTLSLLPDNVCGPNQGQASFTQLRKWQLEQLASIIRDVDEVCTSDDTSKLSDALATHVLPWLESQRGVIQLWLGTAGLSSTPQAALSHESS